MIGWCVFEEGIEVLCRQSAGTSSFFPVRVKIGLILFIRAGVSKCEEITYYS